MSGLRGFATIAAMSDDAAPNVLDEAIEGLSMTEIIRLQDRLSQDLKRRFEQRLALGFSDIGTLRASCAELAHRGRVSPAPCLRARTG